MIPVRAVEPLAQFAAKTLPVQVSPVVGVAVADVWTQQFKERDPTVVPAAEEVNVNAKVGAPPEENEQDNPVPPTKQLVPQLLTSPAALKIY